MAGKIVYDLLVFETSHCSIALYLKLKRHETTRIRTKNS